MKLSAQIWAFVVMLAALIVIGIYVGGLDIDTTVNTVTENRLPLAFEGDSESYFEGLAFRYPRDWRVEALADSITLSRPVDFNNRTGAQHSFLLTVSPFDEVSSLAEALGAGPDATISENSRGGLPAAQAIISSGDVVQYREIVQLQDGLYLLIANSSGLNSTTWDELSDDLNTIMNSLDTQNLVYSPPVLVYELPPNWTLNPANASDTSFNALAPDPNNPEAAINVLVEDASALLPQLRAFLNQRGLTTSEAETALALLEEFLSGEYEGLSMIQGLSETQYIGFPAYEGAYQIESPQGVFEERLALIDPGDGNLILVVQQAVGAGGLANYTADFSAILNGLRYNSPASTLQTLDDSDIEDAAAELTESATAEPEAATEPTESATAEPETEE